MREWRQATSGLLVALPEFDAGLVAPGVKLADVASLREALQICGAVLEHLLPEPALHQQGHRLEVGGFRERQQLRAVFANRVDEDLVGDESLAEEVEDKLAELEIIPKNLEGRNGSEWILLDYGDVVVNIFTAEAREKYHLEKVWGDCEMINYERA